MRTMTLNKNRESLQIRSLLKQDGTLELSLEKEAVPPPKPDEIVVRIDAAPINPSDLGLLLSAADWSQPKVTPRRIGARGRHQVSAGAVRAMAARVGHSMPVGNEGAGTVVEAGSSPEAQALMGKTVAVLGGAMYSEYPLRTGQSESVVEAWHDGRGRRVQFRQSLNLARHDRHHATRGAQGAGAHGRRLQFGPDAESAVS